MSFIVLKPVLELVESNTPIGQVSTYHLSTYPTNVYQREAKQKSIREMYQDKLNSRMNVSGRERTARSIFHFLLRQSSQLEEGKFSSESYILYY